MGATPLWFWVHSGLFLYISIVHACLWVTLSPLPLVYAVSCATIIKVCLRFSLYNMSEFFNGGENHAIAQS